MAQPRKLHDRFFKMAKAEGYAARSAYKLQEIVRRRQLIRKNDWVLDLGCAPGSWIQVASQIVGSKGLVLGLDLQPVTIPLPSNTKTLVGDVFQADAASLLREVGIESDSQSPAPPQRVAFDVVLSDMAPNTEGGGGGSRDHFRSVDLCRRVLELLPKLLRPGGNLAMKVFEGEAYPQLLKDTQRLFREAKGLKPEATREVSREMFIMGLGYEPALRAIDKSKSSLPPSPSHPPSAPRSSTLGWSSPSPSHNPAQPGGSP